LQKQLSKYFLSALRGYFLCGSRIKNAFSLGIIRSDSVANKDYNKRQKVRYLKNTIIFHLFLPKYYGKIGLIGGTQYENF